MQLIRRILFGLSSAISLGCGDVTAAVTSPGNKYFVLESVAGRPIPTIVSAGAGDTTQIMWSTVSLDSKGVAVTISHLNHVYLQYPGEQSTLVWRQAYRIKGDSIEIGSFTPCPPGAMCVGNLHGRIVDSTLAIAEWYDPYPTNPIVYTYHLVQAY